MLLEAFLRDVIEKISRRDCGGTLRIPVVADRFPSWLVTGASNLFRFIAAAETD